MEKEVQWGSHGKKKSTVSRLRSVDLVRVVRSDGLWLVRGVLFGLYS